MKSTPKIENKSVPTKKKWEREWEREWERLKPA